jgi:transcription-repair coupling factor (superfamily II helicase)
VVSPGEYAVRGGLIDLFPMGSPVPYRVDLFDDEIDSIRTFDPDSQRSLYPVPEVRLLPGREFPMDDEARAALPQPLARAAGGRPDRSRIYKDMGNGVATAGIEYYLPLFFDDTATVFDYLGPEATVVLHGDLEPAFQRFWQDTATATAWCRATPSAPCCRPRRCSWMPSSSMRAPSLHAQLAMRPGVEDVADNARWVQKLPDLSVVRGAEDPLARLQATCPATRSTACCCWPKAMAGAKACWTFCAPAACSTPGLRFAGRVPGQRREGRHATAALAQGFSWLEDGIDFVTETELFAAGPTTRRRKKQEQVSDVEALIKDLAN